MGAYYSGNETRRKSSRKPQRSVMECTQESRTAEKLPASNPAKNKGCDANLEKFAEARADLTNRLPQQQALCQKLRPGSIELR